MASTARTEHGGHGEEVLAAEGTQFILRVLPQLIFPQWSMERLPTQVFARRCVLLRVGPHLTVLRGRKQSISMGMWVTGIRRPGTWESEAEASSATTPASIDFRGGGGASVAWAISANAPSGHFLRR
jgi:hypothetical protein